MEGELTCRSEEGEAAILQGQSQKLAERRIMLGKVHDVAYVVKFLPDLMAGYAGREDTQHQASRECRIIPDVVRRGSSEATKLQFTEYAEVEVFVLLPFVIIGHSSVEIFFFDYRWHRR